MRSGSRWSLANTVTRVLVLVTVVDMNALCQTEAIANVLLGVLKSPSKTIASDGFSSQLLPRWTCVAPSCSDKQPIAIHDSVAEIKPWHSTSGSRTAWFGSITRITEFGGETEMLMIPSLLRDRDR